jgi:hypothetical protein
MDAAYDTAASWELAPRDQALLASYVDAGGADETSYDDLFDDAIFRTTQTTFQGRAHPLKPQGQTYYRGASRPASQGMPAALSSAHWGRLPAFGRPTAYASRRVVFAVARDPARPKAAWGGPSFEARTYRFAG